jgi:hypothetical protein
MLLGLVLVLNVSIESEACFPSTCMNLFIELLCERTNKTYLAESNIVRQAKAIWAEGNMDCGSCFC